ncbi:MAG: ABC transporter substrate-binding protein [Chloroflexi bacterium]|nr:ABC transporter substrate-binding protein [Chloroflexota bacterium]
MLHRTPRFARVWMALAVLLALVLAACGGQTTTPEPPTPQPMAEVTDAVTEAPTEVPPSPEPTAEPSPTPEPAPVVEMTDDLGHTIVLTAYPQRIVSLAPSITESLFAIGAGEQVVGRDANSTYPPEVAEITDIGSLWQALPLENILALEPDLVIAAETVAPEQVQQMQDAGLTVFWLANPKDFDGLYRNLRVLAQLTGHEDEAEALIAELQERVDTVTAITADIPDEERPVVFYELDATDPAAPWTSGPGTFIDTAITLAGGRNAGADLEGEWAQMSLEALLAVNPDIIILADAPYGVTPESVAQREGWGALKAVQEGRVYPFDPYLLSVPGPRLVQGLETLAVLLHPDLFCANELLQPAPDAVELVCPVE